MTAAGDLAEGVRITAMCDTCRIRYFGWILPRNRTDTAELLRVFCAGWEIQHPGHEQLVVASPMTPGTAIVDPSAVADVPVEARESMAELGQDADAAQLLIKGALQMALGAVGSGYRSLPELLSDALEDVAVDLGSIEALTRNCPALELAELVEELADGARDRIDDELTAEAATIGHTISDSSGPISGRYGPFDCSCGWPTQPGQRTEGYMHHVTAALENHYGTKAPGDHHVVVVAGGPSGLGCSCGWNVAGDELSPVLVHLRSVAGLAAAVEETTS